LNFLSMNTCWQIKNKSSIINNEKAKPIVLYALIIKKLSKKAIGISNKEMVILFFVLPIAFKKEVFIAINEPIKKEKDNILRIGIASKNLFEKTIRIICFANAARISDIKVPINRMEINIFLYSFTSFLGLLENPEKTGYVAFINDAVKKKRFSIILFADEHIPNE
jgi:hypothetical protein